MDILVVILVLIFLLFLYLRHVNNGMKTIPPEIERLSPHRWTRREILETSDRLRKQPIDVTPHLPPALHRRYIVTGGSGLVGGSIVQHLLARGQSPSSIRIIDFAQPTRSDLTQVHFIQTDISSPTAVENAFATPWPADVASAPLTVFHIAASIRPSERAKVLLHLCSEVNISGTRHLLRAAQAHGADVFIGTSSASAALRPPNYWVAPWQSTPEGMFQLLLDPAPKEPVRDREDYFSNYSYTKACAEKDILNAHAEKFKTGCIRPGSVYGNQFDLVVGATATKMKVESWIKGMVNGCVHAENVSLAHLQFEQALLDPEGTAGGKAFVVADPCPPTQFGDMYRLLQTLVPGFRVVELVPVVVLILAHLIEMYSLARFQSGFLRNVLPELPKTVYLLQPATLKSCTLHQVAVNTEVTKSPKDGGVGYKGVYTTLEGMVTQVMQINDEIGRTGMEGAIGFNSGTGSIKVRPGQRLR